MLSRFILRTWKGLLALGLVVLVVRVGFWPGPSYPAVTRLPLSSSGLPAAPSFESIPPTPEGDEIRLGYHLIVNTQTYAKPFVGNGLSCSNCHLDAGRKVEAGTYVGVLYAYPRYRDRAGKRISLKERINECFERSLNGRPLPDGSSEMGAIQAYMSWLSRDVPPSSDLSWLGFPSLPLRQKPDRLNGQQIFHRHCAGCHGLDGHRTLVAPPLWGPRSFNIGAGLARVSKAAAFIQANMPFTKPGVLSDEEAYDVAAFMNSHARPDYAPKIFDWPKGEKPADSPY